MTLRRYSPWRGRRLSWREAVLERMAMRGLFNPYLLHVAPRVDPTLIRLTNGRLSATGLNRVALVTTTGAKSGQPRPHPMVLATYGDGLLAMGAHFGRPTHPAWTHNLIAHPECEVIFRGSRGRYRATLLEGDAHDAAFATALDFYAGYTQYKKRARPRAHPLLLADAALAEKLLDVGLDVLRLGGGAVPLHDVALLVDEKLGEVPLDLVAEHPGLRFAQEREHGVGLRAVHLDLREHRKRHAVVLLAEGADLFVVAGLLMTELVTWKPQDREVAVGQFVLQLLKAWYCPVKPHCDAVFTTSFTLPLYSDERLFVAVESNRAEVMKRGHTATTKPRTPCVCSE